MRVCGNCATCVVADGQDDPFFYVGEAWAKSWLDENCGICMQEGEDPTVVMLDCSGNDMPCGGDFWEAR